MRRKMLIRNFRILKRLKPHSRDPERNERPQCSAI